MDFSEAFKKALTKINEETFTDASLAAFDFQFHQNAIYHQYCIHLHKTPSNVKTLKEIPFLPIEFFKNHTIKSGAWREEQVFKSSGTTATGRSVHQVRDLSFYHQMARIHFEKVFGPLKANVLVAILPSYQQQGDSSLISMVDSFMRKAADGSGYFLSKDASSILESNQKKVVIGVSYALADLAEEKINAQHAMIMETGGMKGRRKELTRPELHALLKDGLGVEKIWSEYGMTELLSQAYGARGKFAFPSWSKCLIRDLNDPFCYMNEGHTGGINIIDLANIDTCSFIETKDLGRTTGSSFEVLGRFDNSDIRGCNLLVER